MDYSDDEVLADEGMTVRVMSVNTQYGGRADASGRPEHRWPRIADLIAQVNPTILLLQELQGWGRDPRLHAAAERDLAERGCPMRILPAPSRTDSHTAVGYRTDVLRWRHFETKYSHQTENGYGVAVLSPNDAPDDVPGLTVISAHLTAYSAAAAAQEAQRMIGRLYRYGGVGILGGDINHLPVGDQEPDWENQAQPYNRSSRCLPRSAPNDPDEPWRGNRIVGRVLANAGLVDVAAHLATTGHPDLLAPTARGEIRVDQLHITGNLASAATEYRVIPSPSDHDAIVMTLLLDPSKPPTAQPWL